MKSLFRPSVRAAVIGGLLSAVPALSAVGPDYVRPAEPTPAAYRAAEHGEWKEGRPLDTLPKGSWWEVFRDPVLDELEGRAAAANQQIKAAVARVEQARAVARVSRSEFLPGLDFNPAWRRERYSPNQVPAFGSITANTFRVPLDLSYEVDLWGRVRRGFEGARADAQASLAAFHHVLLTLQADVAQTYFRLRALDAEIAAVDGTLRFRREQAELVRHRLEGGIGTGLDVARAEAELASAEAESAALARTRAELETSLGILVGANPAAFGLAARAGESTNWNPLPPEIPAGLPAELLERRPDVAEAERRLAAANARIGVAKAAFFPVLRLTGSAGYVSGEVDNLFNWDSRIWSVGPSLSLPIFAAARNHAKLRNVRAAFEESVADYRQRVLVAFGEVENSLAGIRHLSHQAEAQARALAAARQAARLADERFRAGIVSYLEVVDASRIAFQTERATAQLAGQRLIAAVQLVKALGGGWHEAALTAKR